MPTETRGSILCQSLFQLLGMVLLVSSSCRGQMIISMFKDGVDVSSSYLKNISTGVYYIQKRNVNAESSIVIKYNDVPPEPITLIIENFLLQFSNVTNSTILIDLPMANLTIKKSNIKGSFIKINTTNIALELTAVEYNTMFMLAQDKIHLQKSESYNFKEYCSNETTKFATQAYFDNNKRFRNCENFRPFDVLGAYLMNQSDSIALKKNVGFD